MKRLGSFAVLVFCWCMFLSGSVSLASAQAQRDSAQRATSTPYTGDLSIFEYPDRDAKVQPNRIMDLLHITPGTSVADIGAGSGWFSVRAARRIGSGGVVYAEDINPQAIRFIQDRARKENLENIRVVLGTADDPRLPKGRVHAVVLMKTYHEIAHPVSFMRSLRESLEPGALVGIIDRDGNGSGTDHGVPEKTVVHEMSEAGYRKVSRYDFTKADGQDYFLIFEQLR